MNNFVDPSALILVAIIPTVRDMDIARMLGWYRIPMKHAPKVVDVDYLAFYQPAVFKEPHQWKIEYFARVQGHELTNRAALFIDEPDHPRADEEYYKIQIGSLIKLPSPIIADKWRRLTFLYTTGDLFNRAEILNDLVVRSEERKVLWRALRERNAGKYCQLENNENFDLDEEIIALLGTFLSVKDRVEDDMTFIGEN
jgi:hypothetical protein